MPRHLAGIRPRAAPCAHPAILGHSASLHVIRTNTGNRSLFRREPAMPSFLKGGCPYAIGAAGRATGTAAAGGRMAEASGLMRGKRGLIMGVANNRSIAWGIAKACHAHGAELAFTYQGDALKKRVEPLAGEV